MPGGPVQAFLDEVDLLVRARYTALYVVTFEEHRLEDLLYDIARRQRKKLFAWTAQRGLYEYRGYHEPGKGVEAQRSPDALFDEIQSGMDPALYLLKDLHAFFDQPGVVRRLRDLAADLKHSYKTMVLSAPKLDLPPELEKDLTVLDLPLPGEAELHELLMSVCAELRRGDGATVRLDKTSAAEMARAAQGLTLAEAENAFAKAAVTGGGLDRGDVELVSSEKQQVIRKSGILEYHPTDATLADVGGLANLKAWLRQRGKAWSPQATTFGLPAPKGVLLRVPGCGKSLMARAVAQAWKLPLLHLDLGRVFTGILGSSEENMRRALKVAEGVAPAVLWMDEIEKGLSGGTGGGSEQDGGTATRVFGTLLTWMQERHGSVFVVATANRIEALPPELLRRGRFDEIFFVDLPGAPTRAEILSIHLAKRQRDPAKYDLDGLACLSDGLSGAELEQVVIEGLFAAYDTERDLEDRDLIQAIEGLTPLSTTMGSKIQELRSWAANRARPAE